MEVRPLKSEDLIAYKELPYHVYIKLTGDVITLGGFDDKSNELIGVVAFSPDPVDRTRAFIDYIHVKEQHRRNGIATHLLMSMEQQLIGCRISSLYLKTITDESECKAVFDFFVKNEYVPTVFSGRLMEFKVNEINTDSLLDSFSEPLLTKLKVEAFEKIESIIKKKILAICWANKISVTEQVINSEYTMIMNKLSIEGFLAVQKIDESTLYVWDTYLKDPKTRDATFLSMLSATLTKALSDGKLNPDGTIIISFPETALANNVIKYLGQPTNDKWQQEFSKLLRR